MFMFACPSVNASPSGVNIGNHKESGNQVNPALQGYINKSDRIFISVSFGYNRSVEDELKSFFRLKFSVVFILFW